jgi:hypothetical protein
MFRTCFLVRIVKSKRVCAIEVVGSAAVGF